MYEFLSIELSVYEKSIKAVTVHCSRLILIKVRVGNEKVLSVTKPFNKRMEGKKFTG